MNTTGITTNPEQNVEDYEDLAIKKSKAAKVAAIGGAGVVAGAAIAGGTAYAASNTDNHLEEGLTLNDMLGGAEVGPDAVVEPQEEPKPTTQYVYVEKPAPAPEPEPEPDVVWNETDVYIVDDKVVATTQQGTVEGHRFMIADVDGDNVADMIAIDANDNGMFESDEMQSLTPEDRLFTIHETPVVRSHIYEDPTSGYAQEDVNYADDRRYAYNEDDRIHNNFEDEKTGERYSDDFADNNPDYNPRADVDYGNSDRYLAEDYSYGHQEYHAGIEETTDEPAVEMADMETPEEDSFDSMMNAEEFLG